MRRWGVQVVDRYIFYEFWESIKLGDLRVVRFVSEVCVESFVERFKLRFEGYDSVCKLSLYFCGWVFCC